MARRHASVLLAAIIVIARLVGGGGAAAARTTTEETVRAELATSHGPSRKVRSLHGAEARLAARHPSLGSWLEAMPIVVEEPPRMLASPPVLPLAVRVAALPPPVSQARAPPR